ncbi:hypothetical protein MAR_034881, partial [Mya arenaria]
MESKTTVPTELEQEETKLRVTKIQPVPTERENEIQQEINVNKWILKTLSGHSLEVNRSPFQLRTPKPYKFGPQEEHFIHLEIIKFLKAHVIEEVNNEPE